jgi:ribosomal protein L20
MPAPAQTPTGPAINPERQLKVDVARRAWISRLVDMSRRNNLLFYRDTKTGSLDLTGAEADAVRRLLQSGRTETDGVKLTDLVTADRKVLADLALNEPEAFGALAEKAKAALAAA